MEFLANYLKICGTQQVCGIEVCGSLIICANYWVRLKQRKTPTFLKGFY